MKMSITQFRAKCTQVVREVATHPYTVEITNRGRVVAVVSPPAAKESVDTTEFWGSLKGTVTRVAEDFDTPLGDEEWEASR